MSAKLRRLMALAESAPAVLEQALTTAERVHGSVTRGRDLYRRLHWGQAGTQAPRALSVPDVSDGVVVLGSLAAIHYLTAKGGSRIDQWEHEFDEPLPVLCVAPDGGRRGLVIARGDSRYTVTERGIVG